MQLLTKAITRNLPPLGTTSDDDDPLVRVKFFDPCSSWTWFVTEGAEEEDDFTFFGLVDGNEREFGYFSIRELEAYRGPLGLGIERDRYFEPCKVSELS